MVLRDPIERAWSHWAMETHRGLETLSFSDAITIGRARLGDDPLAREWRVFSYVERGLYLDQINRILSLFPRSQVLFLEAHAVWNNPDGALARIAQFVGVTPFPPALQIRLMANPMQGGGPTPRDISLLKEVFAQDARAAVALAGIDAAHWPTFLDDCDFGR